MQKVFWQKNCQYLTFVKCFLHISCNTIRFCRVIFFVSLNDSFTSLLHYMDEDFTLYYIEISPARDSVSFSLTFLLSAYLPCRYIILVTIASTVESYPLIT